jgi:hypothetical protein
MNESNYSHTWMRACALLCSVLPSSVEQPAVPAMELSARMAAKQAEKQQLMANLAQVGSTCDV